MAMFNGGRMIALFLGVSFSLNVSFAQESSEYQTYVLYMEDPVVEEKAYEVSMYEARWNDPLAWKNLDAHFTPARDAQIEQIEQENNARIASAVRLLGLPADPREGEGIEAWVPSAFPLQRFQATSDSLFSFIENPDLPSNLRGLGNITLEGFILADAYEGEINCDGGSRCAQAKKLYSHLTDLIGLHRDGTRIISLRFKARMESGTIRTEQDTTTTPSYVKELKTDNPDLKVPGEPGETIRYIETQLLSGSVELLRPAAMGDDEWWIDVPPYGDVPPEYIARTSRSTPVGKPVVSETSSWGRIKAMLAD